MGRSTIAIKIFFLYIQLISFFYGQSLPSPLPMKCYRAGVLAHECIRPGCPPCWQMVSGKAHCYDYTEGTKNCPFGTDISKDSNKDLSSSSESNDDKKTGTGINNTGKGNDEPTKTKDNSKGEKTTDETKTISGVTLGEKTTVNGKVYSLYTTTTITVTSSVSLPYSLYCFAKIWFLSIYLYIHFI